MAMSISEPRSVSGFDAINLKDFWEIFLTQGESESLVLEGEEELLSRVKTEVVNGELQISFGNWLDFLLPPRPLKIYVTLKEVHSIKISGAGSLHAAIVQTDHLRLVTSGSSKMDIGSLVANDLDVNLSGAGEFDLSGQVNSQNLQVSGTGKYRARGLACQKVNLRVSGSCRTLLNVQESLDVRVSGSAEVRYVGNPKVQQHVTGSASIRKAD